MFMILSVRPGFYQVQIHGAKRKSIDITNQNEWKINWFIRFGIWRTLCTGQMEWKMRAYIVVAFLFEMKPIWCVLGQLLSGAGRHYQNTGTTYNVGAVKGFVAERLWWELVRRTRNTKDTKKKCKAGEREEDRGRK